MKKIVALLASVCIAYTMMAQLPDFLFRHYTIENGLPPSSILELTQDKDGFIWCEAYNMLMRYDGNEFHIYRHDEKDSFSLPVTKAYKIGKGDNDLLIVGYEKGICYYDKAVDGFRKLPTSSFTASLNTAPFSKNKTIWFSTTDKLLHRFTIATGRTEHFAPCKSTITSLFMDSRNRMWAGTVDGLYRFYPEQNRYELFWQDTVRNVYGGGMITDMLEDKKGDFWFSGLNSGLYRADASGQSIHFFDFAPVHRKAASFYSLTNMTARTINGQEYMVVNSSDGVAFLQVATGNYTILRHDPSNQYSLPPGTSAVYYDNTGTLWVSAGAGVSKSERPTLQFKTVHLPQLEKNKMRQQGDESNTEVNIAWQDQYHNTWIGTDSLGLLQYDLPSNSIIKQVTFRDRKGHQPQVEKLYRTNSDWLWMGTSSGVFLYETTTGKIVPLSEQNAGADLFAESGVSSNFTEDGHGNIWVGTTNGVSIYDAQLHFVKNLKEEKGVPGTLKGQFVFSLYPKNDHQVWVGTRVLNLYDLDSGRFVNKLSQNRNISVLPTFVNNVARNKNGDFYIMADGHCYIFSGRADSFYSPAFSSLIIGPSFERIFIDKQQQLWVTTRSVGLMKVDPVSNSLTRFTVRNGLARNQLYNSCQSAADGPIFMPITDGFQYFYPDSIKNDVTTAPLRITGIELLAKPFKADYQSFANSPLAISYKENVITFKYSLLDYSFPEDITYQYKLEGFDKDWINAGNRRSTTYTNLDAGNYVFRVRAKNHDNTDAGQTMLQLRVVPPFWKTGWFIALAILLVVFALYRWYAYMRRQYKAEKILNGFTASLYGQTTIEDMAWDIAANCVDKLGFVDCVVYMLDDDKKVLVQKAARGPKNPARREILHPMEIPLGKGIVGMVAQSGVAEIINDTSKDKRYIVDDAPRLSEISVPIVADGNVLGVIDSEHPQKNFYNKQHLYLLQAIARFCSVRVSKYITEERLRTRVARDLHDDIGSALSSININSNMALSHVGDDGIVKSQLESIRKNSGNMMESMSDIIWAISPANDSLENLLLKMREFALEILEPLGINCTFTTEGEFSAIKLDVKKRKDIYLFFKEAVNNAAKYSYCNSLSIYMLYRQPFLHLKVEDDGKGFNESEVKTGNGLGNMRERAAAMGAKILIGTAPGKGTRIELDVSVT